jgi:hypothetical protein
VTEMSNWILPIFIGAASAGVIKLIESFISHHFLGRTRREEQRDGDVEIISSMVFEVRDIAKSYWLTEGRDHSAESAITGRILYLGSAIEELLKENILALREAQIAINRFDQNCTSGKFQTSDRKEEPNRASSIESSAYFLKHTVIKNRRRL